MQHGAGCLIFDENQNILLVRRVSGGWTFPKGGVMRGLSRKASAVVEVYEEAGIVGIIGPKAGSYLSMRNNKRTRIHIYQMESVRVLYKYPERKYRVRRFFTKKEAQALLSHKQRRILNAWFKKLNSKRKENAQNTNQALGFDAAA